MFDEVAYTDELFFRIKESMEFEGEFSSLCSGVAAYFVTHGNNIFRNGSDSPITQIRRTVPHHVNYE